MAALSGDELDAWVRASCVRHGVPVKVTDAGVVARAVTLLSGGATRPNRAPAPRPVLQAPDGIGPIRVDLARTRDPGADHDVVQDGGDDGVLTGEVEFGPLSA